MGMLQGLRNYFKASSPPPEPAALDVDQTRANAGRELRAIMGQELWAQPESLSGVTVTEDTAANFASFYACVKVLVEDVSAIPFHVTKRMPGGGMGIDYGHPIHELIAHSPDGEMSAMGMIGAMVWHCLTRGNAYARIERDAMLRPVALHLRDPRNVRPARTEEGKLYYRDDREPVLAADMIHVANVGSDGIEGKSPIRQCMETFGLSIAVEKFGSAYFGNGTNHKGVVTLPHKFDEVEWANYTKILNAKHAGVANAHRFMLLYGSATFTPTTIPADEAQFLGTRLFQQVEMCRIVRVLPSKVMNLEKSNFANLEELNLSYYDECQKPWARRFETEFSRKLFTRDERRIYGVEHDTSSIIKGRVLDQANADKIYREIGVVNADEIRARRNLGGPIEGGKKYMVPLNSAPLDKVADASIETLKGVKDAPPPDAQGDEVDAPSAIADGDTLNALRDVVLDAARRMVKREANSLRKLARRPGIAAIVEGLEEFYSGETVTLADALGPALRAYSAVSAVPIDPHHFAAAAVRSAREQLRACVEGPGTAAAIAALADAWERDKPGKFVECLSLYASPAR